MAWEDLNIEQQIQALDCIIDGELLDMGFQYEDVPGICVCTVEVKDGDVISSYIITYGLGTVIQGKVSKSDFSLQRAVKEDSEEFEKIMEDLKGLREWLREKL